MRILIVENHPDTLHWLQIGLEDLGHAVVTAEDVQQARAELNNGDFDVLLSDILLPDGTGWDLLESTPAAGRVYAIAMSGVGRSVDTARSRAVGYRHHLFKPFPMVLLEQILEETA
jgi:DNA-binding response OmpR family regulator